MSSDRVDSRAAVPSVVADGTVGSAIFIPSRALHDYAPRSGGSRARQSKLEQAISILPLDSLRIDFGRELY
jgi:hypothetical protein